MSVFLTIKETATRSGLSQFYIRNRCKDGTIPHRMMGIKYIYLLGLDIEREKTTVFDKAEFTFWSEETFTWIGQHVSGGARHISSRFSSKVR